MLSGGRRALRLLRRWPRPSGMLRLNSGTTAVETALLLPLMLAFLLGIEELGRLLWTQSVLQFACENAARYAIINPLGNITGYAAGRVFGLNGAGIQFTYNAAGSASSPCGGPDVAAAYTFQPLVPMLVPGLAITLKAQSCLPSS
jgi:hypothetical protein